MKTISSILLALLLGNSAFATSLTLQPGASITVNAGDSINVTCSGSSAGVFKYYCSCAIAYEGSSDILLNYNKVNLQTGEKTGILNIKKFNRFDWKDANEACNNQLKLEQVCTP